MVTAKLDPYSVTLAVASAAVLASTAAAGLVAVIDPALAGVDRAAPDAHRQPRRRGWRSSPTTRASSPRRSCSALLGFQDSHLGRRAGDTLVAPRRRASARSPSASRSATGAHRLLPYIPQLPVEWAALTTAVSAWLAIRTGTATRARRAPGRRHRGPGGRRRDPRDVVHPAPATDRRLDRPTAATAFVAPGSLWVPGGCLRHGFCAGEAGSLQGRALPSPHCARFRSAQHRR